MVWHEKIDFGFRISDIRLFPIMTVCFLGYYIWFQLFYNKIAFNSIFPYSGVSDMFTGLALNVLPIFVIFLLIAVEVFCVRPEKALVKIGFDLFMTCCILTGVNILFLVVLNTAGQYELASINWAGTTFNAFFLLLGIEVLYWTLDYNRKLRELAEREKLAMQYRYNSLMVQVNPHFLFNSLGTLGAIIDSCNHEAKDFLSSLSKIYRYAVTSGERPKVLLEEELAFVSEYTEILKKRYGDKLRITISDIRIEQGLRHLIPYTLQLLVENAIKHNKITQSTPMHINIYIEEEGVRVVNTLNIIERSDASLFGLHYLKSLYEANGRMFISGVNGDVFEAYAPFI